MGKCSSRTYFTDEEINKHNSLHILWVLVGNKVYDITKINYTHIGPPNILLEHAGKDVSKHYKYHIKSEWNKYLIGYKLSKN